MEFEMMLKKAFGDRTRKLSLWLWISRRQLEKDKGHFSSTAPKDPGYCDPVLPQIMCFPFPTQRLAGG
jgi:hypothetical protein